MNYTRTTPKGVTVADTDIFAIRLFVLSETQGEVDLPVDSVLKLVDIFEELGDKQYA